MPFQGTTKHENSIFVLKKAVSSIIREAIEKYFGMAESRRARERVLKTLIKEKPLGDWEKVHEERTAADACRG